ncbi:hypothetical protein [Bartonella sp. DGB1]|uniref:hypothetical protein n=1 Tax=Bartonella sp. DGB1 TaxID=3239807 RepID=UPI003525CDD1
MPLPPIVKKPINNKEFHSIKQMVVIKYNANEILYFPNIKLFLNHNKISIYNQLILKSSHFTIFLFKIILLFEQFRLGSDVKSLFFRKNLPIDHIFNHPEMTIKKLRLFINEKKIYFKNGKWILLTNKKQAKKLLTIN